MKTRNKRLLAKLVKDNAGLFVGAALCTVASVFLGFMTPAVLAEVLDHYLGGMPSRLPPPFDRWALDLGAGGNALGPLLGAGVVIILISLMSPSYIIPLFTDQRGQLMLMGGGFWMATGVFVMRRMINFKI